MSCIICFDEMDMQEFNDTREGTQTCFKLDCGHAYHTKCIIEYLSKTEHTCPSCNKYKTPEQELEREFVLRNLATKIKKDERLRIVKKEYISAESEYKTLLIKLKKEAKEWIHKRAEELKLEDHKNYYRKAKKAVISTSKEVATELGPKYIGALNSDNRPVSRYLRGGLTFTQKIIFGSSFNDWKSYRLLHPCVRIGIN